MAKKEKSESKKKLISTGKEANKISSDIDKEISKILRHADKLENEQYEDVSTREVDISNMSVDEAELEDSESCYNIYCTVCGCVFDAYESDCGKPPFDTECPECGSLCSIN